MNLIGIHMKEAPWWPIKFGRYGPDEIEGAILLNTCNRVQYICEPPQRKEVLKYFSDLKMSPSEYVDRNCVRKLTEISFGLDSVNFGSTIVRKQMLEAKNRSGTRFLKNVVSTIVDVSETLLPYPGYRQFTAAKYFMNILGIKNVHIVTAGEIVGGGKDCYSYWHPEAFNCDGVIFAGSIDSIPDTSSYEDCRYCINFSFRFIPPIGFNDVTELFDSYISRGGPVITNVTPIADLIWYKIENEISKKGLVKDLKNLGISSNEIEILMNKNHVRQEYSHTT